MREQSKENGWKVSHQLSREDVWVSCLGNQLSDIDLCMPFQPEEHGFILSSVTSMQLQCTTTDF